MRDTVTSVAGRW